MANFNELFESVKSTLTGITGVTNWENIGFSMLPDDPTTGYIQPQSISLNRSINEVIFVAGIGIADTTLEGLWAKVFGIIDAMETEFSKGAVCSGRTSLSLMGNIDVALPDTYVNQGDLSETGAYQVAVTFNLKLEEPR